MKKRRKKPKVVYMAVELDECALPLAVFDSVRELAEWADLSKTFATYLLKNNLIDLKNKCRYERVIFKKF